MHDWSTVKKLSDKQLQDLIANVSSKLEGVSEANEATYELLCQQIDLFRAELEERLMMEELRNPPLPSPYNLTDDDLSKQEQKTSNEAKDKK